MRAVARLLRAYVLRFPIPRGKGFVLRHVVSRIPIGEREFEAEVPGGGRVIVRWDEVVGRKILRDGSFERTEIETMLAAVTRNGTAIDVGANVGLVTIPLALAAARVLAIEPLAENATRLRDNAQRNNLTNLVIVEAAAGAADGRAVLHSAVDPAFGSIRKVVKYRVAGDLNVVLRSLDSIWHELNRPLVELVKIDVEGSEQDVLYGSREVLEKCRPMIVIEADPGGAADGVRDFLSALGYIERTPVGFSHENHLFEG
jgi:FkbM family methyltransferase